MGLELCLNGDLQEMGLALARKHRATNHYIPHFPSSQLLKLLCKFTSDPHPLHNHLLWPSLSQTLLSDVPRLPELQLFIVFNFPKLLSLKPYLLSTPTAKRQILEPGNSSSYWLSALFLQWSLGTGTCFHLRGWDQPPGSLLLKLLVI
jgi:hypothetical protein